MQKQRGPYKLITLHHSGSRTTPQGVEILHRHNGGGLESVARRLGAGQSYTGYGDVGYHFMIDKAGNIYEGRSLDYVGGHVRGRNPGNIGVNFLGDFSRSRLSKEQFTSGLLLLADLVNNHGIDPDQIFTHGRFDTAKTEELAGALWQVSSMRKILKQDMNNRNAANSGGMCRPYDSEAFLRNAANNADQ